MPLFIRYCLSAVLSLTALALSAQAQPRHAPATTQRVAPSALKHQHEAELNRLVALYRAAPAESLRTQIRTELNVLFEINLGEKEAEIAALREELASLQQQNQQQAYQAQIREMQTLLSQAEKTLQFRRSNRESIVNQRLAELLGS
ncbi:MAG: hypothetical protein SF053_17565 [Bacteroidia bacterium]|nr:hypothetical protein [Bacteroidia bacterium]